MLLNNSRSEGKVAQDNVVTTEQCPYSNTYSMGFKGANVTVACYKNQCVRYMYVGAVFFFFFSHILESGKGSFKVHTNPTQVLFIWVQ